MVFTFFRFGVALKASANLFDLAQCDETLNTMESYLSEMNKWQLNGERCKYCIFL